MRSINFLASSRILMIFFLLGLAICPGLHANTPLDSSIISMFPKDVTELKYADLSGSRQFAWFPQFQAQLVPNDVLGLEQLLEATQGAQPEGVQPEGDQPPEQHPYIEQVAWAQVPISGSTHIVAIGVGQFDVGAIKMFLDSHGVSPIPAGSYEIYAAQPDLGMPEGYFSLIDNRTVAVGPLEGLQRILEIRAQKQPNLSGNADLMTLISQVNGQAVFWSVLDAAQARTAVQHLVPEVMKFPQANDVVVKLKQLSISVKGSEEMQFDFKVDSGSPKDAVVLSQLLEASMLAQRHQSAQDNPDLAKVLDGMVIKSSGNELDVRLTVTEDQMRGLADQNTFRLLM
jgi:hypothetical protein